LGWWVWLEEGRAHSTGGKRHASFDPGLAATGMAWEGVVEPVRGGGRRWSGDLQRAARRYVA
jgi:hypothetical protein